MGNYDLHYFNTTTQQWESPFLHSADFEAHVNGMTHINYLGDVYDEAKLMTEYKDGMTVERLVLSSTVTFMEHTSGHVVVETHRNMGSWRGYQRATWYSSSGDTNIVYMRGARGTQVAPLWGAWDKKIGAADFEPVKTLVDDKLASSYNMALNEDIANVSTGVKKGMITNSDTKTEYQDWVNSLLGWENQSLEFIVETVKRNGSGWVTYQQIEIYRNWGTINFMQLATITRTIISGTEWKVANIECVIQSGEGSPEGVIYGLKGMRYIDRNTGVVYYKKSSTLSNTGWGVSSNA